MDYVHFNNNDNDIDKYIPIAFRAIPSTLTSTNINIIQRNKTIPLSLPPNSIRHRLPTTLRNRPVIAVRIRRRTRHMAGRVRSHHCREEMRSHGAERGQTRADNGDLAFDDRPVVEGFHGVLAVSMTLVQSTGGGRVGPDIQRGLSLEESLWEKTTTRIIPIMVNLHYTSALIPTLLVERICKRTETWTETHTPTQRQT